MKRGNLQNLLRNILILLAFVSNSYSANRVAIGCGLKYAKWTGTSWSTQTVDSQGLVGIYASLALDSLGNPHIAYYDWLNDDLKYARWTGTSWSIQTVDSQGDVGKYASLVLDSLGNPHIAYYKTYSHTICGKITDIWGNPVSGVTITIIDPPGAGSLVTDKYGYYYIYFDYLDRIEFVPYKQGFAFYPSKYIFTKLDESEWGVNFIAYPKVVEVVGAGEVKIQGGKEGYVNPAEGEGVVIVFIPKETGDIKVSIYTMNAELVWEEEIHVEAGKEQSVAWGCKNKDGDDIASGTYIVHIKGCGLNEKKKVVVVR